MSRSASLVAAAGSLVLAFLIALTLSTGVPERVEMQSAPLTNAPDLTKSFAPAAPKSSSTAAKTYAKRALSFIPNRGQVDGRVRYYAQVSGASFYFTDQKAVFAFTKGKRGVALDLRFPGANPNATLEARSELPGKVNYLTAGAHHTNLSAYREVAYRDLWPGIDLVFRGQGGKLKYEFHLLPGADPSDIRLAYKGANALGLGASGALLIDTPIGVLRDSPPRSYQPIGGQRRHVNGSYVLGGQSAYGFEVTGYDRSRPLVIDPGLVYSTFLGGSDADTGSAVAVDPNGNAYVTGHTLRSGDFPTTPGAFDTTYNGNNIVGDAFVTKLNASGSALVYSTYLGGGTDDLGINIAVDSSGNAYVTGTTDSTDFPTTPGAFDATYNGDYDDAFLAKLNPTGSALVYSTYLGGASTDGASGITVDATGRAYVTGRTFSGNFPTTAGAFDTTYAGGPYADAFVARLNAAGSDLSYSTFLGGSGYDSAGGIKVDAAGNSYLTGSTQSTNFPSTPGAFDPTPNSASSNSSDAFVTKLNATGSALVYSTFLGGSVAGYDGDDGGADVAIEASGNAYVTGTTRAWDFPTTPGAFDTTHNGREDAFVSKLNSTGSSLMYSTYLGAQDIDYGHRIGIDTQGDAYVAGETYWVGSSPSDFPTTPDAFDTSHNYAYDVFVSKLNTSGSNLSYSTFVGGAGWDRGAGIAVDSTGAAYVTGDTESTGLSTGFPTTAGAFDRTFNGNFDAFVTKFDFALAGPPATLALTPKTATNTVGSQHCVTATVKDASGNATPDIPVVFTVSQTNRATGSATTDGSGQATFCYTGELFGADEISAFADFNPTNGAQDPGEPADTATKEWLLSEGTPCRVSNVGLIIAQNGDRSRFAGSVAQTSPSDVAGSERYRDLGPATPLAVKSIDLLALSCSPDGAQASIFGRARVRGAGAVSFRIDLKDRGQLDRDTYRILLQSGYDSGEQVLRSGNVQISVF